MDENICPSSLQLELYLAKMLPEEEQHRVGTHIEGCTKCILRKEKRTESIQKMRQREDYEAFVSTLREQLRTAEHTRVQSERQARCEEFSTADHTTSVSGSLLEDKRTSREEKALHESDFQRRQSTQIPVFQRWLRWWQPQHWGIAVAACMAMLLLAISSLWEDQQRGKRNKSGNPNWLSKGSDSQNAYPKPFFRMLFYQKDSPHSRWIENGQVLHPGDLVQFVYRLPKNLHVMIISMNEQGKLSTFVPLTAKNSVLVHEGKGTLPFGGKSLELDDYIGKERIFIVSSHQPFSLKNMNTLVKQEFIRKNRRLEYLTKFTGPWQIETILIHKRPQNR